MKLFQFVLVGMLLCWSAALSAAPVFKITKGDDSIYIGGTFHLLTEKDYPLQKEFEQAFEAATEVYFETDIKALDLPEFQQKFIGVMTYQDGTTLKTGLNESTYARLEKYAKSRNLNMTQLQPFNPTGIMLTITIMEYQVRGFVTEGVDKFFFKRAEIANKKIAWFETPDEQLAIIDSFDSEDPNGLVNYTLDEILTIDELIGELHDSWRSGNMEKLAKVGINSFADYPEVYKSLIVDRNNNWMREIETMFGDEGTELVLVGALHLPGPDGVLTQLRNKGYTVERL